MMLRDIHLTLSLFKYWALDCLGPCWATTNRQWNSNQHPYCAGIRSRAPRRQSIHVCHCSCISDCPLSGVPHADIWCKQYDCVVYSYHAGILAWCGVLYLWWYNDCRQHDCIYQFHLSWYFLVWVSSCMRVFLSPYPQRTQARFLLLSRDFLVCTPRWCKQLVALKFSCLSWKWRALWVRDPLLVFRHVLSHRYSITPRMPLSLLGTFETINWG